MRVTTTIVHDELAKSVAAAVVAERRGYDAVASMENNHDAYIPLAAAALQTKRVELTTSIALAFSRSPMATAYAAHDLQSASGGRFVLGLGTQVKGHNERRFSVPWSAPVPRMAEYITALRQIWRCWEHGEPLNFSGEHYQFSLMPPNFCPPPNARPVPITVAAVGAAMLRLAGQYCDGVRLHPFCTRRYLENVVLPELHTGLQRGQRSRQQFEISGGGFIATGADQESVHRALEFVRRRVAFYGSTRSYHPVFEQHDLLDLGMKLHQMSKSGQWDKMPAEVPDEVLNLFAAVGTHEQIVQRVKDRFGGVSDALNETVLPGELPAYPADLIAELQRLPADFNGFADVAAQQGSLYKAR